MDFLVYLFWPNPGNATYDSPKAFVLLLICGALILGSVVLSVWRKRLTNSVTRKLSRSWSPAAFWFGIIGLIMAVSRVEGISYLSMRFLWVLWGVALLGYLYLQWKLFRARHYEVVPQKKVDDPRHKYLPKKKK